jgi:hypothetical protein
MLLAARFVLLSRFCSKWQSSTPWTGSASLLLLGDAQVYIHVLYELWLRSTLVSGRCCSLCWHMRLRCPMKHSAYDCGCLAHDSLLRGLHSMLQSQASADADDSLIHVYTRSRCVVPAAVAKFNPVEYQDPA